MNRTLVIPAVLLLTAWAAAQTTPAQTKNPVSTALRDILPGRQKNTVAAVEAMPADKFNYKLPPVQQSRLRPGPQGRGSKRHGLERQAGGRAQGLV